MTLRDRVEKFESVNTAATLDLKPETDINWLIRNIDTEEKASLEFYKEDGALSIEIDKGDPSLHVSSLVLHCTSTIYYRVKNNAPTAKYISAEGYVSRESNKGNSIVQDIQKKSAGQSIIIQPPSGEEWAIHNILFQGPIEIKKTNGTKTITKLKHPGTNSGLFDLNLYATNTVYWVIKHVGTGFNNIGYDGVKVKDGV